MGKLKYKYYTVIKRPGEYGKTEIQILQSSRGLVNMGKLEIQILHNHQEA